MLYGIGSVSNSERFINIALLNHLIQHLMIVFVNNMEISIFSGARVIDVLRAYYRSIHQGFPDKTPVTLDQNGNTIEMDGRISHLKRIYTIDDETLNQSGNYENF